MHTTNLRSRFLLAIVVLAALSAVVFAQTATLNGVVTDPQGAAVAGARVEVVNVATGQIVRAITDVSGHWALPSMGAATYRVTVTKEGFRTAVLESVVMNAGVAATANAQLEIGQLTETVEVNAGAEIVQTANATVNTTLTGRQIFELPSNTRNALSLLVTQPGAQTTGSDRYSTINGLPNGALNVTLDGLNTQDNLLKSSNGFFTYIPITTDAVEEVTLTTSAAGAEGLAQGAAQVKFVTRSGSNEFHGGGFWQHRNTALNANYYFNNINGQPRDRIILNQAGVHVGGPILKNRAFFFFNYEIRRLPLSGNSSRTIINQEAMNGIFTYQDTATKQLRKVDLYQLAAAGNAKLPASVRPYATTPDPIVLATLKQIASLTANANVRPNSETSNDYNRGTLRYQPSGVDKRRYFTTRLDYNLTDNHHIQFVWNHDNYNSVPDVLNGIVPVYPGTGTVLGFDDLNTGQRSNRFSGVLALRSTLSPQLTNEVRGGLNGGTVLFGDAISSRSLFSQWRGYIPNFASSWLSGITSYSSSSRRNAPVKEFHDTLSWVKSSHIINVGFDFSSVSVWQQAIGSETMPGITFGIATNDPVNTSTTSLFTTSNFPNSAPGDRSSAANMYAVLTGRVSSISTRVIQSEKTHEYGPYPRINRDRLQEFGFYGQDTWRLGTAFTLTFGLRFERQRPFENMNNTYSRIGLAGIWGVSGIANMFRPGYMPGAAPQFLGLDQDTYRTPSNWSPSIGFAWQLPSASGPLSLLTGSRRGASVLRAGYSIATVREGMNVFLSMYGSNKGGSFSASIDPSNYPGDFGPPGGLWFRDPSFPSRSGLPAKAQFPMEVLPTDSLNDFDPNLKMGYVQSWNLGFQRELTRDTVIELRYTGNHGVKLWRQQAINEVNIFENKFIDEFRIAQSNLAIARQTNPSSNNFGNQGLPGQRDIPIIATALGFTNDVNQALYIARGEAGRLANNIATNVSRFGKLLAAGYPANFFIANPTVPSGGSYLVGNGGSSFYDAGQIELRRRMASGLLMQGSYVWAHSIANGATDSSSVYSDLTTYRNPRLDRMPAEFDIRHAFKLNWIYELPFGPGKRFASGLGNPVLRKAIEGWEIAGVTRIQSGAPLQFSGGRYLANDIGDYGAVLHNMTLKELEDMVKLRKTTAADGKGILYWLPQDVIDNSKAAFEISPFSLGDLKPAKPYIGPPTEPGQFPARIFLSDFWQKHVDFSVVKITRLPWRERANVEFRAQFLDALNLTNFYRGSGSVNSSSFGQVSSGFRDISNASDPGARMIEFILRLNF